MRVIDGVADVEEAAEQLAQFQVAAGNGGARPLTRPSGTLSPRGRGGITVVSLMEGVDGLLERVPLDEPHRVIGAPAAVGAQAVDRHDTRVLQSAGDLGLGDEPLAADRVVGVLLENLLERHLTVQLGIQGHEHLAQTAARMWPEQAEPLAVAGGPAD